MRTFPARIQLGVCDIEKNYISIFLGISLITIIRRYFAECVIVLKPEYHGTATVYDILHILCAQFTSVMN